MILDDVHLESISQLHALFCWAFFAVITLIFAIVWYVYQAALCHMFSEPSDFL